MLNKYALFVKRAVQNTYVRSLHTHRMLNDMFRY
jgi:hypothetical protein